MSIHIGPDQGATGYQDIVLNTTQVASLNPPLFEEGAQQPNAAWVQCQRNTCRVRLDGANPTPTSGLRLAVDDVIILSAQQMRSARFIADGGAAPTLSVTYFGRSDYTPMQTPRPA